MDTMKDTVIRTFDSTEIPIIAAYQKVNMIIGGEMPVPDVVELFPTNYCNFNCPHCRCKEQLKNDKNQEMNVDLFANLIEELSRMGVKSIHLAGGGEPLEHSRINDILKILHSYGMKCCLYTNGYRLTQTRELLDTALQVFQSIRISLDAASDDVLRRVHGVKDLQLSKIKDAVSYILRNRREFPKLGIKMLISKLNVSDVESFVEQGVELGVDYLQFRFLSFPKELALNISEMEEVTLKIKKKMDAFKEIQIPIEIVPVYMENGACGKCLASLLHPVMDFDGEIYVCPFFENRKSEHSIGNLNESKSLSRLWFSEKHRMVMDWIDYSKCTPNCQMIRYNKVIDFIKTDSYRFDFI